MLLPPPVSVDAFLGDNPADDAHADLRAADVILGVDNVSQKQFIIFGRRVLRRLVRGGPGRGAKVLRITLRQDTEELALLLTLVCATKGPHDYEPEGA
jgi:hypothetical protein